MRLGVAYDTGMFPGSRESRPVFDPAQAAYDLNAIARGLHCPAVRITGGDPERLRVAATLALEAGLEVWLSPFPCERGEGEMGDLFLECATLGERLRERGGTVVLVLGCELSLFARGFLPGAGAYERMRVLASPPPELFAEYPAIVARLNGFLGHAAASARARFGGPLTYAAGLWEPIDWSPFSLIGVDAYRDDSNAATLGAQLNDLAATGKPVAVTEFGCCAWRGAAGRGANGWAILAGEGEARQLDGDYVRDESEQVAYLRESTALYRSHGVQTAFWYTFASWNRPHRSGPRGDLDLASFGLVRVDDPAPSDPSRCWAPKLAFAEFARMAAVLPRQS